MDGGIAVEAHVRAEEVVVGGEEDGEDKGAVEGVEATGGAGVEAIGSVEAFDELFERAPVGGLVVEVFEAEDLVEGEGGREVVFLALGVEEVNAGGIGGKAVEDQVSGLLVRCGACDLVDGDGGVVGVACVGDVIAGDFVGLGAEEEEGVGPAAGDFDIDFVAGAEGIAGALVSEVEAVQVNSRGLAVVEDGLIGEGDLVDMAQEAGGGSGAKAIGDVIREDQSKDVVGAVNAGELHARR